MAKGKCNTAKRERKEGEKGCERKSALKTILKFYPKIEPLYQGILHQNILGTRLKPRDWAGDRMAVRALRMQNAKKAQRDNGAMPTRLTLKKLWGPRLSILCPVPSGGPIPRRFPTHRPTRSKLTNSAAMINARRRN